MNTPFSETDPTEESTMPRRSIRFCSSVAFTALSALAILAAPAAEADGIYKPIFSDSELGTMVAADAKISDVRFGEVLVGPKLKPDDLAGRVVLIELWGIR